jgi:hypothetical protein
MRMLGPLVTTLLLFSGCGLATQSVAVRARSQFATVFTSDGWLICTGEGNGSSTLTWQRSVSAGSVTTTLAFDRPGAVCALGAGVFLVTGLVVDSGQSPEVALGTRAYVVTLDAPQAAIVTQQTEFFAGADLASLLSNQGEQLVYAYDRMQQAIRVTPFAAAANLTGAPWVTVLDSGALPHLRAGSFHGFAPSPGGDGVMLENRFAANPGDVWGWHVAYVGGAWVATPQVLPSGDPEWAFAHHLQNARGPTVSVVGDGGVALAVAGGSDVVAGVATAGQVLELPLPASGLTPGGAYFLRRLSGSWRESAPLTINSMWGSASVGNAVRFQRDLLRGLHIGNQGFAVSGRLQWVDAVHPPTATRDVYLLIAAWAPGSEAITVDPATQVASMESVLGIVGPITTSIPSGSDGHVYLPIPAPDDPGLAGLHITFQWAVDDGTVIAWSEVFGSLLFPAPAATAQSSASHGTTPPVGMTPARRNASKAWVANTPCLRWNQAKSQMLSRLGVHR